MLSIRLARFGKKKQPSFRIVVSQKHKDALGDYIESLGYINYFCKEKTIKLNKERASYWLEKGAKPTDTVHNILADEGLLKAKKIKPSGIKPHKKKASEEEEKGEKSEKEKPAEATSENKPAEETNDKAPEKEEKPAEEKPETKADDDK